MTRFILFIPLALFLVLAVYLGLGLRSNPAILPSTLIDRPLPEFDLPPVGEGEGLASADLVGEVALINVFGTWCAPCRIEHPVLLDIARRGDVPIYGIDWRDEPGAGAAWLAQLGNPYVRVGDDADGRVAIELGVAAAPESFIIDRQGRIRYKITGVITPDDWRERYMPLIEELRAE